MMLYGAVFFDAIRVKVRDEGFVRNKAIYIALGVLPDGTKEILGIWIEQTEGAKFWLRVVTRGAQDILIAVVDGLKGFPRSNQRRFPADRRSDLHRSPDPPFDGFCLLEGLQKRGAGIANRLSRGRCCRRAGRPRRLRARSVGSEVSGDRPELAAQLGARDPVFCFP
jgi:putative transposase